MDLAKILSQMVENSYAHNSLVYLYFYERANINELYHFLTWDSMQPSFNIYLRQWIAKSPSTLLPSLLTHIEEEEKQQHSQLFIEMMNFLGSTYHGKINIDQNILSHLNYTFSEECANKENFGYFLGGFMATEMMSAKRYLQLAHGFRRLNIKSDKLKFIDIHAGIDSQHSLEVLEDLIIPYIEIDKSNFESIVFGLRDRIERSSIYLRWYEKKYLSHVTFASFKESTII